jgi:hypothetical protein
MKHLLTGVAMAAALAIAAPVWAQSTPSSSTPSAAAPAKPMAMPMKPAAKPMAKKPMHHHMAMHHHMTSGDQMTEQLNAQELQRITGGGAAPAPASMSPGGNNPTSGTAGPFAPAGSAPPPPAHQ